MRGTFWKLRIRSPHNGYTSTVRTPQPCGSLSNALVEALHAGQPSPEQLGAFRPDDDLDAQLSLWMLYEMNYRGFDDVSGELEWDANLVGIRRSLERELDEGLRREFVMPQATGSPVEALAEFIAAHEGPSVAQYVHRSATVQDVMALLRMRSIYHLKESNPSAWVVPRLGIEAQTALMELQYDEYGAGDPNRSHAHLFALGMQACGLSSDYGAYIDDAPVEVLRQNNAMSMFGINRRLRGAALGHLAAFEATSSLPCRRMSQGLVRLGFPQEMVDYYDEHVEADAVHEQLAIRTICGSLLRSEPQLVEDVFFGAFACLDLESKFAAAVLPESQAA